METTQCKDISAYDCGTKVILTDQLNYEANARRVYFLLLKFPQR